MPRLSTAIVLTSFGLWRWQDVGLWILRKIIERIWIEYQIYQLKNRFRVELWYCLILVLPALLSVVGLIASLVFWTLYIVLILVKLLAQSTIFFADWVVDFLIAQESRDSALSSKCATNESYKRGVHHFSEDRSALTFRPEMEAGCFVLVARGDEWDEVLLVAHFEGSEWLGYTTTPDGSRFMWTLRKLTLGNFRIVEGRDAARGPPGGIQAQHVNWVCDPRDLGTKWAPTAPQMVTLCGEGRVILDIVKTEPTSPVAHVAYVFRSCGTHSWPSWGPRSTGIFESRWSSWTSSPGGLNGASQVGGGGEFHSQRIEGEEQSQGQEEEQVSQPQFQPESQEIQEEKEKEEAQPIRLQLEFLIDNFFGLKLCPVEASGQEQEGGCGSYGEGRHSSFQEEIRSPHLCCKAPGCLDGQLHQWDPPEAHEGWNLEDWTAERCRADRVCFDRCSWFQGSAGPARSHDYPTGDGLHQSAGDRKGNGRFVHEANCTDRGKIHRRHVGKGFEEGAHPRRRVKSGPSRAQWNGLIGVKRQQLADSLKSLQAGGNSSKLFEILFQTIEDGSGVLSRMLRSFSGEQTAREVGMASDKVFPLPLIAFERLPTRGRSRERIAKRNSFNRHVNICIVAMNWLYAGCESGTRLGPSAVQLRIHKVISDLVANFLRSGSTTCGDHLIREFLRESQHAYWTVGGHCLPLGLKAGVPDKAAVVDLHRVLSKFDKKLAQQIEHPGELLLPRHARPARLPRPFCKLSDSYTEYVKRNCRAGLQKLKPLKTIYKVKGKPLFSGAFAVAKNADEDRAISALCPLNAMVDSDKIWVPRFALMPSLRAMTLRESKRLRIYKKDARHFFHFLKIGKRWEKYMAHPPLPAVEGLPPMFPVHQGVPMGFTAAAAWAQAYNEQKAVEAALPDNARLVDGKPPPKDFPIWGSILDDVWAIEEDDGDDLGVGHEWLARVAELWAEDGVEEHVKKAVEGVHREEVQGAMIDGVEGWVGVSHQKRTSILEAGLLLISQRRPLVGAVDRWVGKLSFALGFRACARSILQDVYAWLDQHRNRSKRAQLWPSVVSEIIIACILLPFLQTDLRAPWCTRVECSDAAPGGHGRAWAYFPTSLVAEASRLCTNKGAYTNISTEFGIEMNADGVCPLQQVRLPYDSYSWKTVAKPGGYRHITLEEAAALNWSLHDRLRHPKEFNSKILQGVDSAAAAGAYKKGRSASRSLNSLCRQSCAILCCGGFEPFIAWMPSGENPADAPSSTYGVRAGEVRSKPSKKNPLPSIVHNVDKVTSPREDYRQQEHPLLQRWLASGLVESSMREVYAHGLPYVHVHLCSGPKRPGDFIASCLELAAADHQPCIGLRIDPLLHKSLDIMDGAIITMLHDLMQQGRVVSVLCSPPCSTWSRARHVRLGKNGPRPLRTRAAPFSCIGDRTEKEQRACDVGSTLAWICCYLMGLALSLHVCQHPYPSLFCSEVATLLRRFGAKDLVLDQCQFGAQAKKPTQCLHSPNSGCFAHLKQTCNHTQGHQPHIGLYPDGKFMTTHLSKYPRLFCVALARSAHEFFQTIPRKRRFHDACKLWEVAFESSSFLTQHPTRQKPFTVSGGSHCFQNWFGQSWSLVVWYVRSWTGWMVGWIYLGITNLVCKYYVLLFIKYILGIAILSPAEFWKSGNMSCLWSKLLLAQLS